MRKNILIEKLNAIEGNPEVLITNLAENLADDTGDGSGVGMYSSFNVSLEPNGAEDTDPDKVNFIALSFDDASRDENGVLIEPYLIAMDKLEAFMKKLQDRILTYGSVDLEYLNRSYDEAIEEIRGKDDDSY